MSETQIDDSTAGEPVKTPQTIAERAICDCMDIAGIMESLAGGHISAREVIEGTHIDLLARLLREKAEAAYNVVTTSANWAVGARA